MKDRKKTLLNIAVSILITILLIAGTMIVYFLAKGYRINLLKREIEKTGVITVNTSPRRGRIYINGEYMGTSPKAISGVKEGKHTLSIESNGYHTWQSDIIVVAEQSLPIYATLFLEEPTIENRLLEEDLKINELFFDEYNQIAIFTRFVEESIEKSEKDEEDIEKPENVEEIEDLDTKSSPILEIWSYRLSSQFWEAKPKPKRIAAFDTAITEYQDLLLDTYKIDISPDALKVMISIDNEEDNHKYFLIGSDIEDGDITELSVLSKDNGNIPQWGASSKHIIFARNDELRSLNTETQAQVILFEKVPNSKTTWTYDKNGYIYFTETLNENIIIKRVNISGGKIEVVTDQIYQQEYVETLNTLNLDSKNKEGNTTNNTDVTEIEYYCNEITNLEILGNGKYLSIFCNNKFFIYFFKKNEIKIEENTSATFVIESPASARFIYEENQQLYQYTIEVEDGNPTSKTGAQQLKDIDDFSNYSNFKWLDGGFYLAFTKKNTTKESSQDSKENDEEINNLNSENEITYSLIVFDLQSQQKINLTDELLSDKYSQGSESDRLLSLCKNNRICQIIYQD